MSIEVCDVILGAIHPFICCHIVLFQVLVVPTDYVRLSSVEKAEWS